MKFLRASALLVFGAMALHGQTPDCIKVFQFTASGQTSVTIDNRQSGCTDKWTVAYQSTGFSVVSLTLESASGAVSAGSFGAFSGSTVTGANPMTSITSTVSTFSGYAGWMRVKLTAATGTGTITGVLFGYKTNLGGASTGGTCDLLGGDVTGTCITNTVVKVNGVAYSASPATDTVEIITASNTASPKALPNCPTNALGYTVATHTFSCNATPASGLTPANTTNPTLTAWTWLNQNGGSVVSGNNLEYISQPTASANTFLTSRESTTALNSAYTVTACLIGIVSTGGADQGYGMYLRDAGGKIVAFGYNGVNAFQRQNYTNSTTFSSRNSMYSGTAFVNGLSTGNGICYKMHDDLTNITMSISFDNYNYQTALVESRTNFMTGAAVAAGFYTQANNANYPPNNSLYSWLQQ